MDFNGLTVICGIIGSVVAVALIIIRKKRFELSDLGVYALAYFAGTNLLVGPYLCFYGLFPDQAMAQTKLHGFEKYIAFAGFIFFLVTTYTLVSIWKAAFKKEVREEKTEAIKGEPQAIQEKPRIKEKTASDE